jgi:hypothetical protein
VIKIGEELPAFVFPPDLIEGSVIYITCAEVTNPSKFYMNIFSENKYGQALDALMDKMQ